MTDKHKYETKKRMYLHPTAVHNMVYRAQADDVLKVDTYITHDISTLSMPDVAHLVQ